MPKPEIGSLCVYMANYPLRLSSFVTEIPLIHNAFCVYTGDLFFIISITEDSTNQIKRRPRLIEETEHKMFFIITSKCKLGWIKLYSYEYRII